MARKRKTKHLLREEAIYKALRYFKKETNLPLSEIAIILQVPEREVNTWFLMKRVPIDKNFKSSQQLYSKSMLLFSVVDLISIYRNLNAMFSNKDNQLVWLKTSHPDLGKAPLELMKETDGLKKVRDYLDKTVERGA